jgi:hypothetical protein
MTDQTDKRRMDGAPETLRAERRVFLQGAAVAAVAVPVAARAEALVKPTDHQIGTRYKESEHIKRFYELNRR